MYIRRFSEISIQDVALVGGKGASLGTLHQQDIPVPAGFVVTVHAHQHYQQTQQIPDDLEEQIQRELKTLNATSFAVRSSATVEDSSTASWAGQFETILHVTPEHIMDAVQQCWRSASSDRVDAYRQKQGFSSQAISLAVVIQQMVPSRISGVCFTAHPVTHDINQFVIEAIHGLGQSLVDGSVAPDLYVVDKHTMTITSVDVTEQTHQLTHLDGTIQRIAVDATLRALQKLSDAQILTLSELCKKIETSYGVPQDIEWAFDGDQLYIVQSRPITI